MVIYHATPCKKITLHVLKQTKVNILHTYPPQKPAKPPALCLQPRPGFFLKRRFFSTFRDNFAPRTPCEVKFVPRPNGEDIFQTESGLCGRWPVFCWWDGVDVYTGVSKNNGVFPPNHPFKNRVFRYKPSILGYHHFGKHPYIYRL